MPLHRRSSVIGFGAVCAALLTACGSGTTPRDTPYDAGPRPPNDAGPTILDAGPEPLDAGPEPLDAEPAPDASEPEPPDAGPQPEPCPRVRVVTPGEVLNVRPSPSTAMAVIGTLPHNALVEVLGTARGESIGGNDLWYHVRTSFGDGYVFSNFAVCTTDEPPSFTGYYVPFACGSSVRISQGPGGRTSHTGRAANAWDFAVGLETPVRAMAPGVVTFIYDSTRPGHRCYNGGGSDCGEFSNLVILDHGNGQTSVYKHINTASVTVGTRVNQGDVIARSGSTGYSTGPHLHVEVRNGCPTTTYCQTIAFRYADIGTPAAPTTVTSGNCP